MVVRVEPGDVHELRVMNRDNLLHGAYLSLVSGHRRTAELREQMVGWFSYEPPRVTGTVDDQGNQRLVGGERLPTTWAGLVDEILAGFNTCLERIAWASARRHTPNPLRRVTFPVYRTEAQWNKAVRGGTRGPHLRQLVGADVFEVMEATRPDFDAEPGSPNSRETNAFWALHELARTARHQDFHLAEVSGQGRVAGFGPLPRQGNVCTNERMWRDGDPMLVTPPVAGGPQWKFREADGSPMADQPTTVNHLVFALTFGPASPIAAGEAVLRVLTAIGMSVQHVLQQVSQLEGFLNARTEPI
jgi:hypothetical protein